MGTKLDPGSQRTEACRRAVLLARRRYAETPEGAAKAKPEDGALLASVNFTAGAMGLNQQTLDKFVRTGSLGIDFADQIAAFYETTVDGLVWLFLHGGAGAVRVGDIPGWAKAAAAARDQYGDDVYDFDEAAEVRLPIAPRRATKDFAKALAHFIWEHAKTSHMRLAAVSPTSEPPDSAPVKNVAKT